MRKLLKTMTFPYELIPTQNFDYEQIIETEDSIVDFKGVCSLVLFIR